MDKAKYLIAKKNGKLEKLRSDEIALRICKKYSYNDQIGLVMDNLNGVKLDELNAYQDFRAKVKAEVDKEFAEIEAQTI